MEENKNGIPSPPNKDRNTFKILTIGLFSFIAILIVSYGGISASSTNTFCASCHEMNPEVNTWKASSHSEIDCASCHIGPGVKNLVDAKIGGMKELYKKVTDSYEHPIRMPQEIENYICEQCHNMDNRVASASGDIIIPHDAHLEKDISCVTCHSGVAHGKVAERKVSFRTDYDKWDKELGITMMSDNKFVNQEMQECMDCHEVRKATLACEACHESGMYPESHNEKSFKLATHGSEAREDLQACHTCHTYLSDDEIDQIENQPVTNFLSGNSDGGLTFTVDEYSRANTYCRDCHGEKPPSHNGQFFSKHGTLASGNEEGCLTCHDSKKATGQSVTETTCESCHQGFHKNKNYRATHPVPLQEKQIIDNSCYDCHSKPTCSTCHIDGRRD